MNTQHMSAAPLDDRGGSPLAWLGFGLLSIGLFGLAYPVATTLVGGALFADAARGSLVEHNGHIVGSRLVAQPFADPRYFIPRPSAAGYAGLGLAGSNWAPSNPALRERVAVESATVAQREGLAADSLPAELVTTSGSGIDPHLSPAGAAVQVARIARARGMEIERVQALLDAHVQEPDLGVFGQPRVNVLELNLALDELAAGAGSTP